MTEKTQRRSDETGRRVRLAWLSTLVAAAAARGSDPVPEGTRPLTITPYQTATFVADQEAAQLLNGLGEFSTQLLVWNDTPRGPVTTMGRVVKTAYLPFYDEWRGLHPTNPRLTAAVVLERVSAGYLSLESPRIAHVTIGSTVSVGAFRPVDLVGGAASLLPVVLENTRQTSVQVVLKNAGPTSAGDPPLQMATLKPHQALGFFLNLKSADDARERRLVVVVGKETKEFVVPFQYYEAGLLRVRVIDETGAPTPARIYMSGADQRAYAPSASMRMVTGDSGQPFAGDCYFYTEGNFAVELPAGPATVEAVKGMEYEPTCVPVNIVPGYKNALEIHLKRRANLPLTGWYSGDVHVHANVFAQERLTPQDVLLVAKAEDLNVTNVLAFNDPRTTLINDLRYFTGGPDAVSERNYLIYYNEEMRNDIFGHVGFLNLKSPVEPIYFGWPHSPHPYDYPGNYSQVKAAKDQGGVVTYVHPGLPGEFPVDIALGLADTIDTMSQVDEEIATGYWYRLLNCGFRCPASAGTDSFIGIPCHLIPGAGRVYVHTGPTLTYPAWIEGYRRGRSFVTNGPLVQFSVNGCEAGDEIRVAQGPLRIEVTGTADSIVPMEAIEVIVNGRAVRKIAATGDQRSIRVAEKIEITQSGWVALRVRGRGHRLVPNDREVYAHTSPVYVTIANRPVASREDALFFVGQIDALIERMDQRATFASAGQRDEIVRRFREGQEVYRKIAAQAR